MEIIIQPDPESAAKSAARIFIKTIQANPKAVLGLATGSTPLPLYRELIAAKLDWSGITTFNLDEYTGIGPGHPQSYHSFMSEHLFQHVNINPARIHIPDGLALDPEASCRNYEEKIRESGGIDLQLLGIGSDGHIGFNEPTSSLASRTRIKTLTERTRRDNARFFGSPQEVPLHVITMGIGTILETRRVVLLATGAGKADAIAGAVEGPVTAMNPASALQLHERAVICLDEAAASKLQRIDYYKWVYNNKPQWQI
ncbi:MAG: Glucosamine-6-phosphate deaminase [Verrucomicrobiota bacterium]|jgi:glucosamine-6-phosphate deaminase